MDNMQQNKRPRARKTFVSGESKGVHRTGSGGGKVGGSGSFFGDGGSGESGGGGGDGRRGFGSSSSSGGGFLKLIILLIIVLVGGGGGAASGLFGSLLGDDTSDLIGSITSGSGVTGEWVQTSNSGKLNTDVAADARAKYTTIKGKGKDTVTIMVYMCGTDLESRSGAATADLQEMLKASVSKKINLIIYTGGCRKWQNNVISSSHNQIYQIQDGKMMRLEDNAGTGAMTDPDTLTKFIKWTNKHYGADRTCLIFWDHGGGSISGYGYDEKKSSAGSMTLSGINKALNNAGVKFDFVGFDACLMATAETGFMLSKHADYMIASEETEPGIGWYYTDWLTSLSKNTSLDTIKIGKQIADDFTKHCASQARGAQTTLSVTDLAELGKTLPDTLNLFAEDTSAMINGKEYQTVSTARSGAREFARTSGIDQIDLVHFALNLDTRKSKSLSKTLLSAVKYNKTSPNMTNAYGLSIYFPYKKLNKVDSVTQAYNDIGMDESYTACIQRFAQKEVVGQGAAGGGGSVLSSLFGSQSSGSQSSQSSLGSQALQTLVHSMLSGRFHDFNKIGLGELNSLNTKFLTENTIDEDDAVKYLEDNHFDASNLTWQKDDKGRSIIKMDEDQWKLIQRVDKAMYYDDGKGWVELGTDNLYDFDDDGNLIADTDRTWLSIDHQPVAYYHLQTTEQGDDKYQITGRVPVMYNGQQANLILSFTNENERGSITGVSFDYNDKETETSAKTLTKLKRGDRLSFLADCYTYRGKYQENTRIGDTLTVKNPDKILISNEKVGSGKVKILYSFTDIYGTDYWTKEVK